MESIYRNHAARECDRKEEPVSAIRPWIFAKHVNNRMKKLLRKAFSRSKSRFAFTRTFDSPITIFLSRLLLSRIPLFTSGAYMSKLWRVCELRGLSIMKLHVGT